MSGNIQIASSSEVKNCCATLDKGVTYYTNLVAELKNAKTKIQANWEGDAVAITDVITRIDQVTATYEASLIPAITNLSTSMVNFAEENEKVSNNTIENSTPATAPSGTANPTPNAGTVSSGNNSKPSSNSSAGGGAGNIVGGALTGAGIGAGIGSIIPGIGTAIGAGVGAGIGGLTGGIGAAIDGGNTFENAFWSKHGTNFAEAWTSRSWTDQWDYSECEGVLDVVGQTADGLIGTVTDVAASVLDTAGAAVNFVVDGLGELFGGLFG